MLRFLTWLLMFTGLPAFAAEAVVLELAVGQAEHENGALINLHVRLVAGKETWALQARVDEVRSPALEKPLKDLRLACPIAEINWPEVTCNKAELLLADSPWGKQQVEAMLEWRSPDDFQLRFAGVRYAGDKLSGEFKKTDQHWQLQAKAGALQVSRIEPLREVARDVGLNLATGVFGTSATLEGDAAGVRSLVASGRVRGLTWSDDDGFQAAEKLQAHYSASAEQLSGLWRGGLELELHDGELYSDPVFLDFKAQPFRLVARGAWDAQKHGLRLDKFSVDAGGMLQASGELRIKTKPFMPTQAKLELNVEDLGKGYAALLQPLLIGTGLDEMEMGGRAEAAVHMEAGSLVSADLRAVQLDMADLNQTFAALGVDADVHWRRDGDSPASHISFQNAQLGRLDFGASRLDFNAAGAHVHLLKPVSVPFYEGLIRVYDLTWLQTEAGMDAGFSVGVEAVSLQALSQGLEWPLMNGTIEGEIPRARFTGDTLRVDGDIEVRAFDGQMLLRKLRLQQLASAAPVLEAELELRGLDLAKVTETFSFGRIRGRLNGDVRDLQLVAWEPNRFQAHFYSPKDDDLPHRISQRAVEDLTELGNGVSGALASPFLRFFKEFSYDRVELKVAQRGDRAEIGGIPHANGGYYLVKGTGIPRIDVIGRNREVAWNDLLARLKSIRTEGIEVE